MPELTEEERARALSIATNHPLLRDILASQQYTVDAVGPWTTSKTRQNLGAGIMLTLSEPVAMDLDWPGIRHDENEFRDPPYTQGTMNFAADNIRRLIIMVDLQRNQLVTLTPGPGMRMTRRPPFVPLPANWVGQ